MRCSYIGLLVSTRIPKLGGDGGHVVGDGDRERPVTIVNSIGNPIFLAGDTRYACPHSTFMFHGVGFNAPPNMRFEEKFLRERLDGIDADQKKIAAIIESRTKLTGAVLEELFLEARTKDAEWALDVGIVHEIRDVNIPTGQPIQALVFQRQGVVGS